MLFTAHEIRETVDMFLRHKLDVRAITLGVSLRDCASPSGSESRRRVRDKLLRVAGRLVETGRAIEEEFGVPIINKRVSVTPISLVAEASDDDDFAPWADTLDAVARELGIDFVGGFSALVEKGMTSGDERLIASIPRALERTERVCSSINLGTTKNGINMDAVRRMGAVIKETAEATRDRDGIGCAKLVVFCNAPGDNPFMAGAFHGPGEGEAALSVGVSGPGVIKAACEQYRGAPIDVLADGIKKTAFKITRMGQLVGQEAARRLGVPFGILDLSLAPTPAVGDPSPASGGDGLESGGRPHDRRPRAPVGHVKKGGVWHRRAVGGLSGAFFPFPRTRGWSPPCARFHHAREARGDDLRLLIGLDKSRNPARSSAETISGIQADEWPRHG
jgi:uncharacterized protein (UPF0210 family)